MHTVTLLDVTPVTPDTRYYVFGKPSDYSFRPGQATDFALDRDGWRDEQRPFTFVSDPEADVLCFTIKSYPDHDGVTQQLCSLKPGDTVLLGEPWGAIQDRGAGVFIAAGAGITPFVGILKDQAARGVAGDSTLIFANSTERDIILRDLWETMDGLTTHFIVSEGPSDLPTGQIDAEFLKARISDWDQMFYLCGPPAFEEDMTSALKNLGVAEDRIVKEEN
jgi:ferredoxin-NADP reductase